ncbi:MAG: hypothetical protein AAE983_05505 [Thermoplasmataceae archaeon]|jgi:O-antigen/teichoic acid export membrane protein
MDQKTIDKIVKIRKLSYSIIAFFTLLGVILSAFQGFLSTHPIILYIVLFVLFGIFFAAIFLFPRYKNYHYQQKKEKGLQIRFPKSFLAASIIVALFEISIIIIFSDWLGVAVALTVGIAFSFIAAIWIMKNST